MAVPGVQAAIATNDNSMRLTYVPKFYDNAKDTFTTRKFIVNWNNTRKCAEFCHLLHSEANGFMSATLKKVDIANEDWDEHKKLFLKYFDVKGMAKLNFFALHDMKQGPTGKVCNFWTKIQL